MTKAEASVRSSEEQMAGPTLRRLQSFPCCRINRDIRRAHGAGATLRLLQQPRVVVADDGV